MAELTTAQAFLIFAVVESIQMAVLIYVNVRTNRLWSSLMKDPVFAGEVVVNATIGFMDKVANDKATQDTFFGFVQTCGVNAMVGVQNYFGKAGVEGKPIKTGSKLMDGILNSIPGVKEAVGEIITNKIKGGVTGTVQEVADGW